MQQFAGQAKCLKTHLTLKKILKIFLNCFKSFLQTVLLHPLSFLTSQAKRNDIENFVFLVRDGDRKEPGGRGTIKKTVSMVKRCTLPPRLHMALNLTPKKSVSISHQKYNFLCLMHSFFC